MAEPVTLQEPQEGTTSTVTIVESDQTDTQDVPRVRLKLRKPRNDRKVKWSTETVDNENMNKKKSKCCCIYEKPRKLGESSSDDSDEECDHCRGHVEKKKTKGSQVTPEDGRGTCTLSGDSSQTITVDN